MALKEVPPASTAKVVRLLPEKAANPMDVTLAGMVMEVSEVVSRKA